MTVPLSPYASLLEIVQRRQGTGFIGRSQFIERFQQNLTLDLDDPSRRFIFAISGPSGVGKTWLMRQLQRLAQLEKGVCALWDSGDAEDPMAVMVHLADQMARQGLAMPAFASAYQAWRQNQQRLANNLDHLSGVRAFLGDRFVDSEVQWGHRQTDWGIIVSPDLTAIFEDQQHVRERTMRQLLPDEEQYERVVDPVATFTPIWLADLRTIAAGDAIAFFFDDVNRAGGWLLDWLHQLLSGAYGDVPVQSLWIMAGVDAPDQERWLPLADLMAHFALKPFPQQDVTAFLHRYNGHQPAEAPQEAAPELPLHLAVQAAFRQSLGRDPDPEDERPPLQQFVAALPPEKQRLLLTAALPRSFDRQQLALLMGEQADDLTEADWLFALPILQPAANGWRFHQDVRRALIAQAREQYPEMTAKALEQLALAQRRLADDLKLDSAIRWTDLAWRERWLTHLSYRLLQDPAIFLGMALDAVIPTLELNPTWTRALARELIRTGQDGADEDLIAWGERIMAGADALLAGRHKDILSLLDDLIASEGPGAAQAGDGARLQGMGAAAFGAVAGRGRRLRPGQRHQPRSGLGFRPGSRHYFSYG